MHKRIRTLILPCFCWGTLVAVIGNAFAECPKSTVYLSGTSGLAPDVVATEVSDKPTARVSYGRGTYASYDRNTRTVEARAEVWWDEGYNYYSRATVVEHFALKGVSATPVTLRLVLEGLSGTDSACRTATVGGSARLEAGGQIATAAVDCAGHLSVAFLEVTTFMTDAEPLEARASADSRCPAGAVSSAQSLEYETQRDRRCGHTLQCEMLDDGCAAVIIVTFVPPDFGSRLDGARIAVIRRVGSPAVRHPRRRLVRHLSGYNIRCQARRSGQVNG